MSWTCSYFTLQVFIPILFALRGPIERVVHKAALLRFGGQFVRAAQIGLIRHHHQELGRCAAGGLIDDPARDFVWGRRLGRAYRADRAGLTDRDNGGNQAETRQHSEQYRSFHVTIVAAFEPRLIGQKIGKIGQNLTFWPQMCYP